MHIKTFLHKTLSAVMHKKRLETLSLFVTAVLESKRLSLTQLGRALILPIQERSCIRRSDRFLGNTKLHQERVSIYKVIANKAVGCNNEIDIIVDWSNIPNTTHHVLRAALVAEGRAITLYEEVHPEKKLGNKQVQNKFLHTLKELLPQGCGVLIMTDGGFHNGWFREILSLGWDYLGRIRAGSGKKFCATDSKVWQTCVDLCQDASDIPRHVGEVGLGKNDTLRTNLYLFKGPLKGRKSRNKLGKVRRDSDALDYSRAAREPWILATSLTGSSYLNAKMVINKYKKRMQIEEGFRDLKSSRYGFCFEHAYSKKRKRIEVLLLIAMIASYLAWIIGWVAEKSGLHLQFQANTIRTRRVLSFFYLGCRIIKKKIKIPIDTLEALIDEGLPQC